MEYFFQLIDSISSNAWTALITACLTSVIAFTGVAYSNRENRKRLAIQQEFERKNEQEKRLRANAEELYVLVQKFCNFMVHDHFHYVKVLQGRLSEEQALDLTLKAGNERDYDSQRMFMLADIYFPEVADGIKKAVDTNGKVFELRGLYLAKIEAGKGDRKDLSAKYLDSIEKLSAVTKKLKADVVSVARNV